MNIEGNKPVLRDRHSLNQGDVRCGEPAEAHCVAHRQDVVVRESSSAVVRRSLNGRRIAKGYRPMIVPGSARSLSISTPNAPQLISLRERSRLAWYRAIETSLGCPTLPNQLTTTVAVASGAIAAADRTGSPGGCAGPIVSYSTPNSSDVVPIFSGQPGGRAAEGCSYSRLKTICMLAISTA